MKNRLLIAFALGVLAGIVLWPDGSDSPDSGQQSVKPPKVSASGSQRMPPVRQNRSHKPMPESALLDRGQMPQYGMRPVGPGYGFDDWYGQYNYGSPSGQQWNRGAEFPNAAHNGAVPSYGPSYNNPMYQNFQDRTGFRFRPLNGESDSDDGRRYTGGYQAPPQALKGTRAPRWNESPTYGQPQPRRRYVPAFENQKPYYQPHPGDLYSAR